MTNFVVILIQLLHEIELETHEFAIDFSESRSVLCTTLGSGAGGREGVFIIQLLHEI